MGDIVVTVSKQEEFIVPEMLPDINVETIGHILPSAAKKISTKNMWNVLQWGCHMVVLERNLSSCFEGRTHSSHNGRIWNFLKC